MVGLGLLITILGRNDALAVFRSALRFKTLMAHLWQKPWYQRLKTKDIFIFVKKLAQSLDGERLNFFYLVSRKELHIWVHKQQWTILSHSATSFINTLQFWNLSSQISSVPIPVCVCSSDLNFINSNLSTGEKIIRVMIAGMCVCYAVQKLSVKIRRALWRFWWSHRYSWLYHFLLPDWKAVAGK